MDFIPQNELLRSHPDTKQKLQKMYNLERPGEMDEAITVLEEWLKKQHHLTRKTYPRSFLERSIILQKGSLERTKAQINNICAMRTLLPEFFEITDSLTEVLRDDPIHAALLPALTEDNYRIFVIKLLKKDPNEQLIFKMLKLSLYMIEYAKAYDYCCGAIIILDYRNVKVMDYIAAVNISHIYHLVKIMMVGYGLRLKGIHIVTPMKAVYTFVEGVKKFFNPKVANRLYVHESIDTLYEYVPRDILPTEFGGTDGLLATFYKKWKDVLSDEEMVKYFKEISQDKSTEAYKMKDAINDPDLGISGSFRSLNVD